MAVHGAVCRADLFIFSRNDEKDRFSFPLAGVIFNWRMIVNRDTLETKILLTLILNKQSSFSLRRAPFYERSLFLLHLFFLFSFSRVELINTGFLFNSMITSDVY